MAPVTLLVCWLVFPLVLILLALGAGLLLERAAATRLPGPLLPAAGLALVVVVAQFATLSDATAELTTPAVVAVAVAGVLLSPPWRRGPIDVWALVCGGGVFAFFAAPVVLSGEATFAGYIKLDDTATWLAMTDRVMEHGRNLDGLAPSTYEATLSNYLATAYPVGSFLPLGLGGKLVGQDAAWLFQPYLALLATMMALVFYVVIGRLISSPAQRAVVVIVGAQPALLFGFSLWGGVKELAAAWIVALVAALAATVVRGDGAPRALVPLAVACAAGLGVLSFGGIVWMAPALLASLVAVSRLRGLAVAGGQAIAFSILAGALSLPALLTASEFLRPALDGVLTSQEELGNLIEPLSWLQLFGIWPVGDFRLEPGELEATYVLIVVLVAAAALGLLWAARRGAWELPLYMLAATVGCVMVAIFGAPWVDAKTLATATPAFTLAGLTGAFALFERGRRVEATVVAAAIAGGVLWSNALAFHEVPLAPRDRLAELERIGGRIAGQGPTLMTEYEPYGVRHFLREADAEGASELRRRLVPLRNGRPLPKLGFADIDRFQLDGPNGLLVYRTLVLRRSPAASRPPSAYRLVSAGRYYEVWQRPDRAPEIADHLALGSRFAPAARPSCNAVERLARAAKGGSLAAMERPPTTVLDLTQTPLPRGWQADPARPGVVYPSGPGKIDASLYVPTAGRHGVWLAGAFRGRLRLFVDHRLTRDARHELSHEGSWVPMGAVQIEPGTHRLSLTYDEGALHPGSGGQPFALGPLALAPETIDRPVTYVPAADARSLCGKRLDWVEALRN